MLLDLPPELLLKIFQKACLDAGQTGRSLSAVSHSIRDISAEYRYQSLVVEVTRCRTTRLLLRTLLATPDRLRRIRHLYVNRSMLFSVAFDPWFGIDLPARFKKERETGRDIHEILRLAAPHLQTLTLLFNIGARDLVGRGELHLEDIQMPMLRELTLDCPVEHFRRVPHAFAPSLKRLCIPSRLLTQEFGRAAAVQFPHLTVLLIHPLKYLSTEQWRTLRTLMYTMRLHSTLYTHGPDVSDLPVMASRPRRYIIVQPQYAAPRRKGGAVDDRQATLADLLKNCSARAQRFIELPMQLHDPDDVQPSPFATAWKQNWLDSVQGKLGIWAYRKVSAKPPVREFSGCVLVGGSLLFS